MVDWSLSLCLHVIIKSFVRLVLSGVYIRVTMPCTGCLEGIHTILIMDKIQTGPDQRLTCLSFEQMLAVSEAVPALLGDWSRQENDQKRFSLFFHHSILMGNQQATNDDTATNRNQTKARTPPISLVANNIASVVVIVCLFLVTMVMKTLYNQKNNSRFCHSPVSYLTGVVDAH